MSAKSSEILSEEIDDIDIIISQVDEMDVLMSQIHTEKMQQDGMGIPGEIMEEYVEAVSEINDEMVHHVHQEEDVEREIPLDLMEEFNNAMNQIIPLKSGNRYLQAYEVFRKWQEAHRTCIFDERIVLAYFGAASKKCKPPTLWSMYSMLKKTLLCKHNVDLVKYCRLRAFLKMKSDGYEAKKANVFEAEHIRKFFLEAPNDIYLGMKVVMIFGLVGGCRGVELTNLTLANVKENGKEVIVKISETKMKRQKLYVVGDEFAKVIRQYMKMRPPSAKTDRLFLQWRKGKCVGQVMGKNSIAKIPKQVATFLNLRFGDWKSNSVCEGYIQNSVTYKREMTKKICDAILASNRENVTPSTSVAIDGDIGFENVTASTMSVASTSACAAMQTNSGVVERYTYVD